MGKTVYHNLVKLMLVEVLVTEKRPHRCNICRWYDEEYERCGLYLEDVKSKSRLSQCITDFGT